MRYARRLSSTYTLQEVLRQRSASILDTALDTALDGMDSTRSSRHLPSDSDRSFRQCFQPPIHASSFSLVQHSVDVGDSLAGICEDGGINRDLPGNLVTHIERPGTKRVMHATIVLQCCDARVAEAMTDRDVLRTCTSVPAVCAQPARSKIRDKSTSTVDASMTVRGVGDNERVGIAAEIDARVADEIEEDELVVA